MRVQIRLFILLCFFQSSHVWAQGAPSSDFKPEPAQSVAIQGDLKIPEDYEKKQKIVQEREQVIPMKASEATSPGSFGSHILQYQLGDVLENSKIKPIKGVKGLEKTINETSVDSSLISIKPKLDVNHLKAEMDIETFVKASVWTEDSFQTLRAQMKLYELENNQISIENKFNSQDTRTYLNLKKTW